MGRLKLKHVNLDKRCIHRTIIAGLLDDPPAPAYLFTTSRKEIAMMAPAPTDNRRRMVVIPADVQQRIDDFRYGNRIPTEAEAIRQILVAGLDAKDAEAKAAKKGKS